MVYRTWAYRRRRTLCRAVWEGIDIKGKVQPSVGGAMRDEDNRARFAILGTLRRILGRCEETREWLGKNSGGARGELGRKARDVAGS